MFEKYFINIFLLLLFVAFLNACAGTTQVEFEPAIEQEPEEPEEPEPEEIAKEVEDAPADEPVEAISEPIVEPPQLRPYDTDIAATAEQLYGTDPGDSEHPAHSEEAEVNPMLRYTIIYFDFNKSAVKADARELLSHHARFMGARPEVELRIEGHADQRGTSGYNLALGESRANAVRTILEAYGIDGSRISVISYGEEQPAVDATTEEAFSLNRRAELIYP